MTASYARGLVAALLLLVALTAGLTLPDAHSQVTRTTVFSTNSFTSTSTFTSSVTSTITSTGSSPGPAQTITSMTSLFSLQTVTSLQQSDVMNEVFRVDAPGSSPCTFLQDNFTGSTGEQISGTVTSDVPVDFYLLSPAGYSSLTSQITGYLLPSGSCGSTPAGAFEIAKHTTSFNFTTTLQNPGEYGVVVFNQSPSSTSQNSGSPANVHIHITTNNP